VLHADVAVEVVPVEWILVDHHNIMVALHQIMVVVMEEVLLLTIKLPPIMVNQE
tara:strand:+ start:245 stop:406 length:162 start_codon:yes stop_codon:yes gene_type:complete